MQHTACLHKRAGVAQNIFAGRVRRLSHGITTSPWARSYTYRVHVFFCFGLLVSSPSFGCRLACFERDWLQTAFRSLPGFNRTTLRGGTRALPPALRSAKGRASRQTHSQLGGAGSRPPPGVHRGGCRERNRHLADAGTSAPHANRKSTLCDQGNGSGARRLSNSV